jgi:hypothetical protein
LGTSNGNGDPYGDLQFLPHDETSSADIVVYWGTSTGLPTTASQPSTGLIFGSVRGAGDFDGDGYGDVYTQFHFGGTFPCPLFGSVGGLGALHCLNGGSSDRGFSIGDVNRDGYDDIATGSPTTNQVFAFLGGTPYDTEPDGTYTGTGTAGTAGCGGGDVNGDGVVDFAVGAPSEASNGRVHVFYGQTSGVNLGADISLTGDVAGQSFGSACSL